MQRINDDLNVMSSIVAALENTSGSPMMLGNQAKRTDVVTEVELVRQQIQGACKRLLKGMTQEEQNRLDIKLAVGMFGANKKSAIIKELIKE